jgi:hypothetical protein
MRKVAVSHIFSRGDFLRESPANLGRGLETTIYLRDAKWDFSDQQSITDYVTARDPDQVGKWLLLDITGAGVG